MVELSNVLAKASEAFESNTLQEPTAQRARRVGVNHPTVEDGCIWGYNPVQNCIWAYNPV